ncbi:MAG: peptide chain release factor 1 [Candidatus Diapherotrites archaeon]|nr:peptide chain release factor 1 [Candidatus Diapherotrites archaeon]
MEDAALKRLIRELENIRGTGTQLISLYIPPKYPRGDIMSMLTDEHSKAGNIKDKTTRKNVQAALAKIMNYLKAIDYKLPENGLVVFCGNISQKPGEQDIRLYPVAPPMPVSKIYRCDSTFYLDPLREMVKPTEYYMIVTMDGKEATIALVKGNTYDIVARIRSLAPGKHHAGGQSARRFERLREIADNEYLKKLAEEIKKTFEDAGDALKGIILAGPGPKKNEFYNKDYLPNNVKEKILGIIDTGYTNEYGIREALENAKDILRDAEIVRQKQAVDRFIGEVIKGGLAEYGLENVYEALKEGRVDTLLVSEDAEAWVGKYVCQKCGTEVERLAKDPEELKKAEVACPNCGATMQLDVIEDAIEEMIEMAENTGAEVFMISPETEEGQKLSRGFGGVGAIVRYKA